MKYSFIIPIYNRPEELDELLNSLVSQTYEGDFEVVVIEDGSTITSEQICKKYQNDLLITYLSKPNTGPGDSRNYGMQRAQHDYFLILDYLYSFCCANRLTFSLITNFISKNITNA